MGKAEKDKCDLEEQAKEDQRRMEEQRQIMKAWREQGIFYA
jgi:predicted transcriptional regulator YheO